MVFHQCSVCEYIYGKNAEERYDFENLPNDWRCPECGSHKESFFRIENKETSKVKND